MVYFYKEGGQMSTRLTSMWIEYQHIRLNTIIKPAKANQHFELKEFGFVT